MHEELRDLTSFPSGLSGFDGSFEGSDVSMFCSEGSLGDADGLRTNDMRIVLSASLHPGTRQSQAVGNGLINKSLKLAALVRRRDQVVTQSRGEIHKLMGEIVQRDARVNTLAKRALLPTGAVNPNADPRDVAAFNKEYTFNKALGRRVIALGKVNALATVLRNNAVQQTSILQNMAVAQAVGQPNVVAGLATVYNTLGRESDKIREIRAAQLQRGQTSLGGFGDLDELGALTDDPAHFYWEYACLAGACPGPGGRNAPSAAVSKWWMASKGRREMGRKLYGAFKALPEGTIDQKYAHWIALSPKQRESQRRAHGEKFSVLKITDSIPGVKQIARATNYGLKGVAIITGQVLNAACALATSGVARGAIAMGGQIGGPIVGGVVGGGAGAKVGTAAGPIASRQASDLLVASCRSVKGLKLDKGRFNTQRFARETASAAKKFAKKNLTPKQLLADAMKVGGAFMGPGGGLPGMGGGMPSIPGVPNPQALLNSFGGQAIQQLGLGGQAQAFIGQALKATGGQVTASGAGRQYLQQFGGAAGNALVAKLGGNTLRNNAVAQATGNAVISGSVSPYLQQVLGL